MSTKQHGRSRGNLFSALRAIALLLWCSSAIASAVVEETLSWHDRELIRSQFVILHVEQTGEASVVHLRPSNARPSRCLTPSEVAERRTQKKAIMISYDFVSEDSSAIQKCVLGASDPRVLYHDHVHNFTGEHGGGMLAQDGGVSFTVHLTASHIHVVDSAHPDRAAMHSLRREFAPQQDISLPNSHALHTYASKQVVGDPSDQYNLVFVSAGFDGNSRANFDADVSDFLLFLEGKNTNAAVSAAPFPPYYSVLNAFSVFIPSNEIGASIPSSGQSVDNNLGCSYGYEDNTILTCNRYLAMLAASYTPVDPLNTLVVVVVNAKLSGGSGGANVAVINNEGERKYALLMHMIAHAASDLSDEYSYGSSETKEVPMLNCHWSDYGMPWQGFKERRVVPIATKPCTFANYFRPTPGECIMAGLQAAGLCPVCKFNQLKTMYDHGMQLASPTYPNKHETAYLVDGASMVLYMNPTVPYLKSPEGKNLFTVDWTVDGSNFGSQVHRVGFGMQVEGRGYTYPGPGTYYVNLTITDNTQVILDDDRQNYQRRDKFGPRGLLQIFTFTIVVFPAHEPRTCSTKQAGNFGTTYCATCRAGKVCDLTYASNPLKSINQPTAQLSGLEIWMVAVGIIIVGLGVLLFYGNWRFMIYHQERNPVEILPLTDGIMYVRALLIGVQLCVLIIATFSIVYSVYQLGQLEIFGQPIMLGVIACAAVVWLGSYVGLVAAYFKNRSLLFVNFILLLLLFGCVFLFSILLVYVLTNLSDPGVQEQLVGEWNTAVANTPEKVCRLQMVLECSGYNSSCAAHAITSPGGSSNCPANCPVGNLFQNPCSSKIRTFIKEHFGAASAGGWVLTCLLLIALLTSVILGCAIKNRRNVVHRERRVRHATGQNILEPEEIAMLRKEFDKIDIDGSGDISRDEFSRFYNSVMGTDLSPRELEEYFDRLDADGNGTLSFEEFLKVYVPHREPKRKSMVKPKNLQYIESDSDEEMVASRGATPRQEPPPPPSQPSVPPSARSDKYAAPQPQPKKAPDAMKGSYQESAPPSSRQAAPPPRAAAAPPPAHKDDFDFDFGGSPSKKAATPARGAPGGGQQQKKGYDDLDLDIDLDAEW